MRNLKTTSCLLLVLCCGLPLAASAEDAVAPAAVENVSSAPAVSPPAAVENVSSAPVVSPPAAARAGSCAAAWCKGAMDLELNYPGAAVRYFVADGKALELLGQAQKNISVAGWRYYRYAKPAANALFLPFWGVEADYAAFKGDYSKGNGFGAGAFAGVEYRLGRRLSFMADIGTLYMSVKDKDTSLSESGMDFLVNFGVNIYISGGRP